MQSGCEATTVPQKDINPESAASEVSTFSRSQGKGGISVVDLDAAYGSFVREISSSPPFRHLFTKQRSLLGNSCILNC